MIDVGLAGVGPLWSRYRPALSRLRHPIQIAALYDVVFARADRAVQGASDSPASPFTSDAAVLTGLQGLARRNDLRAVLLMDSGWQGVAALRLLGRRECPVFVAPWLPASRDVCLNIYESAEHVGVAVMPAMWRRFTPATIRLQELIATDLGRPCRIVIDLPTDDLCDIALIESLVGWLDYCRNLFRNFAETAVLAEVSSDTLTEPGTAIDLKLIWAAGTNAAVTVRLSSARSDRNLRERLAEALQATRRPQPAFQCDRDAPLPKIAIQCQAGSATLTSRTSISWSRFVETTLTEPLPTESAPAVETLTSDRTEEEIMLDLFCRRVVGGLIPVADFRDVTEALRLLEAATDSGSGPSV